MTRYEELLSLYLDGDPSEAELDELEQILREDEKLAKTFQEELLIWEAWSQEHAPERSADSFLSGFHTRLRAEQDAPDFELAVTRQLKNRKNPLVWQPVVAIAAVLVIVLSLSVFFNPADIDTGLVTSAEAGFVHIHGECVCMRCTLNKAERCSKAVRFTDENGVIHMIRIKRDPELKKYNKSFCRGPTAVVIEGEIIEENGQRLLLTSSLTLENEEIIKKM